MSGRWQASNSESLPRPILFIIRAFIPLLEVPRLKYRARNMNLYPVLQ